MIALFWFPITRTLANVEVNYNEGWNAYRANMAANRIPLYGAPPSGFESWTSYPPISFHLISMLGTANTFLLVGRVISLISLFATGIFVALVVRQGGGSQQAAVFSFLLYEIGIALLKANRIGMNDPQLLGEALSTAGLYFYVRNPASRRLLCLSALLLCLAGFTKQNVIAFPAAVGIDLLFRSRKAFAMWCGAMLLFGGGLLGVTFLVDGRYFLVHLMTRRPYSYAQAWSQFHAYLSHFQGVLLIGTAWSIYAFRTHRVFRLAFILSHSLAFLLAGGLGVDLNIFFNAFAATVITCGLALSDITSSILASRPGALNAPGSMMFALFFISVMMYVPGQMRRDLKEIRDLPVSEREFDNAVEFLKSRPGPALCESLLLCYEASKPLEYDAFDVSVKLMTGKLHEDDTVPLLRTHHFQTIEITLIDESSLGDPDLRALFGSGPRGRFTLNFMKELLRDYQLSMRNSQMAIFTPN